MICNRIVDLASYCPVTKVACGGVHTLVLLQPTLERNVLCQPTGTSPEQSLNDSSQSSSLTSTVHRYQGFLSLRTSPSPPHSLSSSHSSSQPLPPISVARKRRRALKQQTHSSAVDYSHLGETGSVSTPGSGPYPGSDVTGDNGGDISDIEVTDTELSDEGTATEVRRNYIPSFLYAPTYFLHQTTILLCLCSK